MELSKHFKLGRGQAELDFVDVDPSEDRRLFIDPYAFAQRQDPLGRWCEEALTTFFQTAIDCIRSGDEGRGARLFVELGEPNETSLGMSTGRPSGRGVGLEQGAAIYAQLAKSKAVASGVLDDLSESELFIPGIGPDKVSDLTTNVIREQLISYTQAQCRLHGVTMERRPMPPIWDIARREWRRDYFDVPVVGGRSILFVPKGVVRFSLAFLSDDYYDDYVVKYLQDEALESRSNLVRMLKDGTRWVAKKDIKERHPKDKEWLLEFSQKHPDVLERYRKTRTSHSLANRELTPGVDESEVAKALIQELHAIPPGRDAADRFHSAMMAILEFLFYPHLQEPRKEWELHEGRKRIDILQSNIAEQGFFARQARDPRLVARTVVTECKNYSKDVANEELDQLAGRFGDQRGRLGFLISRSFDNRALFVRRCQDTARDNNGVIIPLVDEDVIKMLSMAGDGRRDLIDQELNARLMEVVAG